MTPYPQVNEINFTAKRYQPLVILENGNQRPAVTVKKVPYKLQNTCGLDSISHVVLRALYSSEAYQALMRESSLPFDKYINHIASNGVSQMIYQMRAELLINKFDELQLPGGLVEIPCDCSLTRVAEILFENQPSCSYKEVCMTCEIEKYYFKTTLPIACKKQDLLENLSQLVNDEVLGTMLVCPCGRYPEVTLSDKHFILEITDQEFLDDVTDKTEMEMSLAEIPKTLIVLQNRYKLRGVVGYRGPTCIEYRQIGHFTAFCLNSDNDSWHEYDDVKKIRKTVKSSHKLTVSMLYYSV